MPDTIRIDRWSSWVFSGCAIVLGITTALAWLAIHDAHEGNAWRDHTRQVIVELGGLHTALLDVESSGRGYMLAGSGEHLGPLREGSSEIVSHIAKLRELTEDNARQQTRLDQLDTLSARKVAAMNELVELRRRQGAPPPSDHPLFVTSRETMAQARSLLLAMQVDEERLLRQRDALAQAGEARSQALVIGSALFAILLLIGAARLLSRSAKRLQSALGESVAESWVKGHVAALAVLVREEQPPKELAQKALDYLATTLALPVLAFYQAADESGAFELIGTHGVASPRQIRIEPGDGVAAEAARSGKVVRVKDVPPDYLAVSSGLGHASPREIIVVPLVHRERVEGLIELGTLRPPTDLELALVERAGAPLGVALATTRAVTQVRELLRTSQQQEEELRVQQEELAQTNEELEEQARVLSARNEEIESANQVIAAARDELAHRAEQLATASQYKSEFLSNMSHELRTPLNSMLILSQQLSENAEGNLSERQVVAARTVNASGRDLLNLINDILDLAKVESGTLAIEPTQVAFVEIVDALDHMMRPVATQGSIDLSFRIADGLPRTFWTDGKRLQQILKNLLSNALKFAPAGRGKRSAVKVDVSIASGGWSNDAVELRQANRVVAFAVEDNGIGIASEKQELIFEAFQQADGSVSRRFGGTGLGLSISRDLAHLLGGELTVKSAIGEGSTFTLYLPLRDSPTDPARRDATEATATPPTTITTATRRSIRPAAEGQALASLPSGIVDDDHESIMRGDRIALIVEDDVAYASILVELAREHGFKAVVSTRGLPVISLARELRPDAITLDVHLPDANGWDLLERLKADLGTRHIPVHVITFDSDPQRALRLGAHGVLSKPASREAVHEAFQSLVALRAQQPRRLLIVEDSAVDRQEIVDAIGAEDVVITTAHDVRSALDALGRETFDCIVLDLGLPDASGRRLLDALQRNVTWRYIPVIVYTARDLSPKDEIELRRYAQTVVLKTAASLDRLLDETSLFLHRVHSDLPAAKQRRIDAARRGNEALRGRTILVADDDMRNVFALTGLLEAYGVKVIAAENGREAVTQLEATPNISLVLMDVMMPEMDGLQAMRVIRTRPEWKDLPIIALTAKAMRGDREACLAAGASDYITKPLDTDKLVALLRVWLHR